MTDHTINENETDNIMGKKENENLEDLFAEVEQLIAHMEEDISLDESFVCYEQGMKKLKHCSDRECWRNFNGYDSRAYKADRTD